MHLRQWASNVRLIHLGQPLPQQPTQHALYGKLLSQAQRFVNRLGNTGKPWMVEAKRLDLDGVTTQYTVDLPDGGKILSVSVNGQTYDGLGEYRFDVPLVEVQDVYQDGAGLRWNYFTLEQLAIYRDRSGQWKVRVVPTMTTPVTLEILYTIGSIEALYAPEMSLPVTEFHAVIELSAALSLLPQTRWSTDAATDQAQRQMLLSSLAAELAGWEADFETYKKQLTQPRVVRVSSEVGY